MGSDSEEWLRLPRPEERCAISGLKRSSLLEILEERDPKTGEKLILSIVKRKPGAKRGIRMINKKSLLEYLQKAAEKQSGLVFADHVNNVADHSIEEVLSNRVLFASFIDPECEILEEEWARGVLANRQKRLLILVQNGIVVRTAESESNEDSEEI